MYRLAHTCVLQFPADTLRRSSSKKYHVAFSDVEEGTDVGVVQGCDSAGFSFEAGSDVFALGDVVWEDFDGDGAVEAGVAGFVDFAHAAQNHSRTCNDSFGASLVRSGSPRA